MLSMHRQQYLSSFWATILCSEIEIEFKYDFIYQWITVSFIKQFIVKVIRHMGNLFNKFIPHLSHLPPHLVLLAGIVTFWERFSSQEFVWCSSCRPAAKETTHCKTLLMSNSQYRTFHVIQDEMQCNVENTIQIN